MNLDEEHHSLEKPLPLAKEGENDTVNPAEEGKSTTP